MEISYTLSEIGNVARQLWETHHDKKIWAFYAPMGAGKTTLIQTLCNQVLGVEENITSPTFALINEYFSKNKEIIYHMDWYRLEDESEAIQAGMEEIISSGHRCFIEWPEKAPLLLPQNSLLLEIETISESRRRIFEKN